MALVLADRVKETTTTTGTATYTLAGAATGFESFASIGDGNTTYYACTDGTDFEVGIGTYTASGTTLARTTILQSSNSDSAVSWSSGTKTIFCCQPAEKAVFRDASGHIIALDGRNLTNVDATTLDSLDSTQFLRSDAADTKTSGNLAFSDNVKATFGNSSDLRIYHDATNSYVYDAGTGYLNLATNGTDVRITSNDGSETMGKFIQDGAVEFYYDNNLKISTTSTGAEVTGTLVADTITADVYKFGESFVKRISVDYTGGGDYLVDGEYQKILTITPDGISQNYTINGRIVANGGANQHTIYVSIAVRANTLPDLDWTATYNSDIIGSTEFMTPRVWAKETTTAGWILVVEMNAQLFGRVTADLEIIARSAANLEDCITVNSTEDSEQTTVDTGFTQSNFTKTYEVDNGVYKLLNSNNTKLETTSTGATVTGDLTLTSTDDGATVNPSLILHRDSASPADFDVIGNIQFDAENSAGEQTSYAQIYSQIADQTDGTEDGYLQFWTKVGGTDLVQFRIGFNTSDFYGNVRINPSNVVSDPALIFEGSTANDFETFFKATDPTADRTITLPDASGTLPVFTTAPTSAIADGTNGQVLTTNGSGALSFTTVSGGSSTPVYFDAYKSGTAQTFSTSAITVNFDTARQNSDATIFSNSSGEITVNDTGVYKIEYSVVVEIQTYVARSEGRLVLERKPSGGSFAEVAGTVSLSYNRQDPQDATTQSISIMQSITSGDTYRVRVSRNEGTSTLRVAANKARFNFFKID